MRFAVPALLLLSFIGPAIPAADVKFERVWPEWRDTDSFMSISEYFTGKEATGGWKVIRTHKESRAGYYFLVRVKNAGPAANGASFVLQVITPVSGDPKTYRFAVNVVPGNHVFEIGLTGVDWSGRSEHPVAWKVELVDAAGHTMAEKSSFLWEKPEK